MLRQRRRRWPNINQVLCQCLVFVGNGVQSQSTRKAALILRIVNVSDYYEIAAGPWW